MVAILQRLINLAGDVWTQTQRQTELQVVDLKRRLRQEADRGRLALTGDDSFFPLVRVHRGVAELLQRGESEDIEAIKKMVAGTARSMGIEIES